jgi:hypothetical protein
MVGCVRGWRIRSAVVNDGAFLVVGQKCRGLQEGSQPARQTRGSALHERNDRRPPEHPVGFGVVGIRVITPSRRRQNQSSMPSSMGGTPRAKAISRAAICFSAMKSMSRGDRLIAFQSRPPSRLASAVRHCVPRRRSPPALVSAGRYSRRRHRLAASI